MLRAIVFLFILLCGLASAAQARTYVAENNQAVELLQQGRYVEGIDLLKQSLERVPYDTTIRANLLKSYQAAGREMLKQKRFREVAALLLDAQQFDDRQREFWTMRGYALLRLKRYDEAEIDLQEARGMGQADPNILYLLGQIYYITDRMYEAFDVLESAELHAPADQRIVQMLDKVRRELAVEKEMEKEYSGNFVITFEGGENAELGSDVLDVLEDAYRWFGLKLDHYPEQRVTVILYTQKQFSELTDSPDWAAGLFDGKIRLPVGGISRLNDQVRGLLYHEYAHVVLRDIAGNNLPFWLNEGIAELAEREMYAEPLRMLPLAKQQNRFFPIRALEGSFKNLGSGQIALAYEQSYSFVHFLVDRYGWYEITRLLALLGSGLPLEQALEGSIGSYGVSYAGLERRWKESLVF